ncbi:hypothetical protein [Enterobacter hormaechei]|nr:hypothetical protein [Enterobacter hormaechei]AWZ98973.1 hypothetical protein CSB67_2372 [Enterobacter hormaechei]
MGTTVYHGPNVIGLWWPVLNSGLLLAPQRVVTFVIRPCLG